MGDVALIVCDLTGIIARWHAARESGSRSAATIVTLTTQRPRPTGSCTIAAMDARLGQQAFVNPDVGLINTALRFVGIPGPE